VIKALGGSEGVEPPVFLDLDDVPTAADKTLVGSASATSTGVAVVDDVVVDGVAVDDVCATGGVPNAGVGGANIRINAAKLTTSDEKSEA
jgi:hypothetical protein